jgi:2-dehydro-3-deoxygluconokinase
MVVVKNGGGPMLAAASDGIHCFAGFEKRQPVDSTGAGDSFYGGLLAALAQGSSLDEAIGFAHRVSAEVIMHRGALVPMKTLSVLN